MTEKQKNFMLAHGLITELINIGLNPDTLSTAQASGVIAKFYDRQEAAKESERIRLKYKLEKEEEIQRMLGQIPDYDTYPNCGYDRSWAGS